jgi:hypothetical protein
MKKIKVDVKACDTYYHKTYYAQCRLGRGECKETLVEFWQSFSGWAFDTKKVLGEHGGFWNGTDVSGAEFPAEYFKRLCQAVWILKTHDTEFPEIEFTVGAKKQLGIQ